ncbi:MAG: SRPBCC family protein [Azonexus sp.]
MAEYHLRTIWRIKAPLEKVYDAILNSLAWPEWWPGVEKVEQTACGDADGINSIRRYSWRGELPYSLILDVRATGIQKLVAIEGEATGDLEGFGRWHFSRKGLITTVHFDWHVHSTKWWMNLVAPVARALFIRNHSLIMTQGGEGLARRLKISLLSQENTDLMASDDQVKTAPKPLRERGSINTGLLLFAGLTAGIIATVVQMALWRQTQMPVFETLFRDARLTAALVMGSAVLPPPATAQWDILLVASLIHFALSIIYALLPVLLLSRLQTRPALIAGAFYGLLIYGVNLYGFTMLFPWFTVARDWVTLVTHLVFGVALVGACHLFTSKHKLTDW